MIAAFTTTGTASEIRDRVAASRDAGVTEVAYQPAGPDIPRELVEFHRAVSAL